jgi:hypothetical protein
MESWLSLAIPGGVLGLVALGAWELQPRKRRRRPGTPLSATYVNEITALFYGSKRTELDHRDSWSMMREEDAQGGPPLGVDLDRGVVVLGPDDVRTGSEDLRPGSEDSRPAQAEEDLRPARDDVRRASEGLRRAPEDRQ